MTDSSNIAKILAKKHPVFVIHTPTVEFNEKYVSIQHKFTATGSLIYLPSTKIFGDSSGKENIIKRLSIILTLVEALSYWKASYSPKIVIEPKTSESSIRWLEDLLLNGMMEYKYINNLSAQFIPEIQWEEDNKIIGLSKSKDSTPLVLVSGGKDSTITLSILSKHERLKAFVLNCLPSAERVLKAFPEHEVVRGVRNIDPVLFELNKKGYLNGHTPFSALLSVISTIAAVLSDSTSIITSNEASAEVSFAKYCGINVNHQYSKSSQYENKFNNLINNTFFGLPPLFSFLRPLSEPQICLLLSNKKELISLISSCNKNQLSGSWCGKCPKCISTWILLRPYIDENELIKLFGSNALEEGKHLLPALLGKTECRPLECVGTPEELDASLRFVAGNSEPLNSLLSRFPPHLLPNKYEHILKKALEEVINV